MQTAGKQSCRDPARQGQARVWGAPATRPTQQDSSRRADTSVGLRSCASSERWSSTWNCVHQLRARSIASIRDITNVSYGMKDSCM